MSKRLGGVKWNSKLFAKKRKKNPDNIVQQFRQLIVYAWKAHLLVTVKNPFKLFLRLHGSI